MSVDAIDQMMALFLALTPEKIELIKKKIENKSIKNMSRKMSRLINGQKKKTNEEERKEKII